ncbi:MAG: DedA family protein [bacterium]|nr:DedA family protein [bacterium]
MTEQFITFLNAWGYLAVFATVFLREIGVPDFLPPGFILVLAGAISATTNLSAIVVFLAATVADILGASLLYFVFKKITSHALDLLERIPIFPWRTVHRYTQKLHEKDSPLFVGRMTPFIRGYVAVSAGIAHMPYPRYLWIVILSSALWNAIFVIGGRYIGESLLDVLANLHWPLIVIGVAVGYALVRLALFLWRRHRA